MTKPGIKTTAELKTDDVFGISSGSVDIPDDEFEVWTDPVPTDTSNGRLAFMAKDMATNQVIEHQAQPDFEWEIR